MFRQADSQYFLDSHHQNFDYFRSESCKEQNDTGMSNYGKVFI
jgi:hypothetical protein